MNIIDYFIKIDCATLHFKNTNFSFQSKNNPYIINENTFSIHTLNQTELKILLLIFPMVHSWNYICKHLETWYWPIQQIIDELLWKNHHTQSTVGKQTLVLWLISMFPHFPCFELPTLESSRWWLLWWNIEHRLIHDRLIEIFACQMFVIVISRRIKYS